MTKIHIRFWTVATTIPALAFSLLRTTTSVPIIISSAQQEGSRCQYYRNFGAKPQEEQPPNRRQRLQTTRRRTLVSSKSVSSSSASSSTSSTRQSMLRSYTTCGINNTIDRTDLCLPCSDGMVLTGQSYRTTSSIGTSEQEKGVVGQSSRRILCLHGWMDNCRSFYYFAPHLLEELKQRSNGENVQLVALDFPGHGRSSHHNGHRPSMVLAEAVVYVAEALRALEWITTTTTTNMQITLVGHSMGAAVSCLYAAAFPEQMESLILIEGVGPVARPAADAAKHVRSHVEKRLAAGLLPLLPEPRRYESLELAVAARCRTARTWPGNQYLSEAAARELVEWGTRKHTNNNDDDKGVQFRHDPRLQWPSLQFFTQEQTDGVYKDIQCPTALIMAEDGWPFNEDIRTRTMALLQPVLHVTLPGSHHLHMDPDTAQSVVDHAAEFINTLKR